MAAETTRPQDSDNRIPSPASAPNLPARRAVDSGRTILVGILGGMASAVGYAIYQRLPEDQRERINDQARGFIASRLNELRSNFNL